jgi:hypothetical protein
MPVLPNGLAPLHEPPPPAPSVLAERTRALLAAPPPAVAASAPKQAQEPPSRASIRAAAPELLAKQNQYMEQWEKLRPSVAGLPLEEQERQRAALKQATVGK